MLLICVYISHPKMRRNYSHDFELGFYELKSKDGVLSRHLTQDHPFKVAVPRNLRSG